MEEDNVVDGLVRRLEARFGLDVGSDPSDLPLFALVDADEEIIRWRSGRSLPYGDGISLWALGEIVKAELGLLESDDRGAAEAKLAESLEEAVSDPSERDWVTMHLRPLVGLGESGRAGENRSESVAA